MKRQTILALLTLSVICSATSESTAESAGPNDAILRQDFNLGGERSPQTQYFQMESKLISYALDGKRVGLDVFRLCLKCVPAKLAGTKGDEYTCTKFTVQLGDDPEVEIPALKNWTYMFKIPPTGVDKKGQTLGIDHTPFENLVDANNKAIPPDKAYHVYNAFIDFHGFCNVFAERVDGAAGIQDLKSIGQRIVHAAAFSEAPVNVGSNVSKGSTFKNGEVTLEFKGISRVAGATCALVGYDSGESSFQMIVNPMPNMEIRTKGSSHYMGDLYIDLATNWVRKATLDEFVVTEVTLPTPPNKVNGVVERDILIRNVTADEFARQ